MDLEHMLRKSNKKYQKEKMHNQQLVTVLNKLETKGHVNDENKFVQVGSPISWC